MLTFNVFAAKPNSVKDLAVMIEAYIDSNNKKVILNWSHDTNTYKYIIYKKLVSDSTFGSPYIELNKNITTFTDSLSPGTIYEYQIERDAWDYWAYGYIAVGYDIPPVHYHGTCLILCDDSVYVYLEDLLDSLKLNLSGDGWKPFIEKVPRTIDFNSENVQFTKSLIVKFKDTHTDLKSVILIGRVAVPYSGSFAVDGHSPDHDGAWPTDVFYSVFEGSWTDNITNIKSDNPRIINLPGDGKYDQTILNASSLLEIGRIDMYNLPAFQENEIELLRRYLIKNHNFRNSEIKTSDSTIVNDFFGLDYREGFAASGWMNFAPVSGINMISNSHLRDAVKKRSFLLAYGCGAGSFNSVSQTVYTDELASTPFNAAFSLFFGSYNGDWDSEDNVLRATLAAEPFGLGTMWSGRPFWFLHHLAIGYNLGYSTKLSQNALPDIYPAASPYARRFNHIALLGDPTLRLHYVKPVDFVIAEKFNDSIMINWSGNFNKDNVNGYYVYRSNSIHGKYILLNSQAVKDTFYIDIYPNAGINHYMIRVEDIQYTASGSYNNLSTGKISNSIFFNTVTNNNLINIFPNPISDYLNFIISSEEMTDFIVTIIDLNGKQIFNKEYKNVLNNQVYEIQFLDENGMSLPSNIYLINFKSNNFNVTQKVIKIN
ncbi:MAG: T9SS type A sorting domain-containing protein [Candidatus Kapabacteria bacterium]|nr:T9SS type A sorting domain-containing protein [Ignavibacteriota bacterium]MCW5883571.1 T9SS type A sorting domain-containing protein [Candidatus Kapabacteria bacterium]